jgi:hypothetical protein
VVNVAFRADQAPALGDLKRGYRIETDLPDEAPLQVQATVQSGP